MRGLLWLIKKIFELIVKAKNIIPPGIAGLFVITTFIINTSKIGIRPAFEELIKQLFMAEKTINTNVTLAMNNSPLYTFGSFIGIVSSLVILFFFIKWVGNALIAWTGSQARWGAYAFSLILVFLFEMAVDFGLNGGITIIPVKDGLFLLVSNWESVLLNIHYFGYSFGGASEVVSSNSTFINETETFINSSL